MSQRRNGHHGGCNRKKLNRYNPNRPRWAEVHVPLFSKLARILKPGST